MNTTATEGNTLPDVPKKGNSATTATVNSNSDSNSNSGSNLSPSPNSAPSPNSSPKSVPSPTKVTVEIPTNPNFPATDPFDPTWIKLWEQAGPIGYLGLMCLFVWLLTRLIQTVKGK